MQIIHRYGAAIFLCCFATHTSVYGFDLHTAAACNKSSMLKLLIEQSADIDVQDEKKWTALHHAASNGHINCLKFLHMNGYEWDQETTERAIKNGHYLSFMYAIENGCPWNNKNCMKYAVENRSEEHTSELQSH